MIANVLFSPEYPGSEGFIRCIGHFRLFFFYGDMRIPQGVGGQKTNHDRGVVSKTRHAGEEGGYVVVYV